MTSLQIFNYNQSPIEFEVINGQIMANATLMFAANGARLDDWKRSPITQRYVKAVTEKLGIGNSDLIVTRKGGNDRSSQGTWIHERLILNAARYISVDFEIWCDERIAELLRTGSTSIAPLSNKELALMVIAECEAKEKLALQCDNLNTVLDNLLEWVSIIKIAQHNKVSEKNFNWRVLKLTSQQMGYDIKKAASGRFEYQNLYNINVFCACYPQYKYDLRENQQVRLLDNS